MHKESLRHGENENANEKAAQCAAKNGALSKRLDTDPGGAGWSLEKPDAAGKGASG